MAALRLLALTAGLTLFLPSILIVALVMSVGVAMSPLKRLLRSTRG